MKRSISIILMLSIFCTMPTFASAAEATMIEPVQELSAVEYYAYMDLESADKLTKEMILEARNEIIFSESWVADEVDGWITNPDGTVVEVLPHFSELFPSDWDVPAYTVDDTETVTLGTPPITTQSWDSTTYLVKLTNPPANTTSTPFATIASSGFVGTQNEYHLKTISTVGYYTVFGTINPTYNVGYANATTGTYLGSKLRLPSGQSFNITPPQNSKIEVRASTYNSVGEWVMIVAGDRYDVGK